MKSYTEITIKMGLLDGGYKASTQESHILPHTYNGQVELDQPAVCAEEYKGYRGGLQVGPHPTVEEAHEAMVTLLKTRYAAALEHNKQLADRALAVKNYNEQILIKRLVELYHDGKLHVNTDNGFQRFTL